MLSEFAIPTAGCHTAVTNYPPLATSTNGVRFQTPFKSCRVSRGLQGAALGGEVDLKAEFGFTADASDHSGQFNRPIQKVGAFYRSLEISLGVKQPE